MLDVFWRQGHLPSTIYQAICNLFKLPWHLQTKRRFVWYSTFLKILVRLYKDIKIVPSFQCSSNMTCIHDYIPSLCALDAHCAISDCNSLMYADDVKLFYTFDDDQPVLQLNFDLFVNWRRINLMDLNLRKCKCMVFSRRDLISPIYVINYWLLETVTTFLDLISMNSLILI